MRGKDVLDDPEGDLQLSLPSTRGFDGKTLAPRGQWSSNMGSVEKALDSRGQLLNPSGINCPIPSTVFPLEIESDTYNVVDLW